MIACETFSWLNTSTLAWPGQCLKAAQLEPLTVVNSDIPGACLPWSTAKCPQRPDPHWAIQGRPWSPLGRGALHSPAVTHFPFGHRNVETETTLSAPWKLGTPAGALKRQSIHAGLVLGALMSWRQYLNPRSLLRDPRSRCLFFPLPPLFPEGPLPSPLLLQCHCCRGLTRLLIC